MLTVAKYIIGTDSVDPDHNQPYFQESPSPATARGRTARVPGGGGSYATVRKDAKNRLGGSVTTDTVCSALRVQELQQRHRTRASDAAGGGVGEAVGTGSRGKVRGRRGRRATGLLRKCRPRGAVMGKTSPTAAGGRDEAIAG